MNRIILIAGGTGLIGTLLVKELERNNHKVRILTRNKRKCDQQKFFFWDPDAKELDRNALTDVDTIINLTGAGIADKRWTSERKRELIDSRVKPALFLESFADEMPGLKQYISASGINCYPIDENSHAEADAYGSDFLSHIVKEWEQAAKSFEKYCPVTLVRISTVLTQSGGALEKMAAPFKLYVGSPLGNGQQPMCWVHQDDLIRAFVYLMKHQLEGAYNVSGEQVSNKEFSRILATHLHKPMLPFGVPGFVLKLVLGQMSEILLKGPKVDTSKLQQTGFSMKYKTIEAALNNLMPA